MNVQIFFCVVFACLESIFGQTKKSMPLCLRYSITKTWDNKPITHEPINIMIHTAGDGKHVILYVNSPYFRDPQIPEGTPKGSFDGLMDYETVGVIFQNDKNRHLDIKLSPRGQHSVTLFKDGHQSLAEKLPLDYTASIYANGKRWRGTAKIPGIYFPPNVSKFNAYAVHGSKSNRMHTVLYPAPEGKFRQPNIHRLEYSQNLNFKEVFPGNAKDYVSEYWKPAVPAG